MADTATTSDLDAAILRAVVDSGRCEGIEISEEELAALLPLELAERVRRAASNP